MRILAEIIGSIVLVAMCFLGITMIWWGIRDWAKKK